MSGLRARVINNFKLQGLLLRSDATSLLVEVLSPHQERQDIDDVIDHIIEAVQKQPLETSLVTKAIVEVAIEECNETTDADVEKALMIIDAFSVPKFAYNPEQKKFLPVPLASLKLHSGAEDKGAVFKDRYTLLYQRTLHHELFTPSTLGQPANTAAKFILRSVEHMLSSSGLPDKTVALGMLTQRCEGKFHLEDPTGSVELDLSQCAYHSGLFVESCIVLAEGRYEDLVFHVSGIGLPPVETAADTRAYFGNVNFFGGPSNVCAKASVKLQAALLEQKDAMFIFVSEVYLDDQRVLEKLEAMFTGYSDAPPTAFVLMGNFISTPHGPMRNQNLREGFKSLGDIIVKFPTLLEKSQFVFVPGPLDPGPGNVLPKPAIPSILTQGISERVPGAHFSSNPCRIQFGTEEMVVFREDIINKMCRQCVHFPSGTTDMPTQFVKTILSQAHLCPLPLHARPTYWTYDHTLWLYPIPDLVVIGDKCDPYTVPSSGCTVINPGSFLNTGFEFKVYIPSTKTVEDSKISH